MPRKNNRKHCEYEERLGFNPNRYLASSRSYGSTGSTNAHSEAKVSRAVKAAQAAKRVRRVMFDTKPSLDRHKTHSSNRRKRRGFYMIRRMERSADYAQWAQRKFTPRSTTSRSYGMI